MELGRALAALKGRRVLVTGSTGFKGSWLSLWLAQAGVEVTGLALEPQSDRGPFVRARLPEIIRQLYGDVRDSHAWAGAFRIARPEVIFHLAAQPLVRRSYEDPKETFDTNVGGLVNLCDAIRKADTVRSLVLVTSDKCYQNNEWVWGYRETDRLGGADPYSASKAAVEVVFEAYRQSFFAKQDGLATASARAGNVIGGGDWSSDRIIPDCVRAVEADTPVELRNPRATRPWQHVLEPLSGYIALAGTHLMQPGQGDGAWNFGPAENSVTTVAELVEVFLRALGRGTAVMKPDPTAGHEAHLLQLSIDKARRTLGWEPRWSVEQAVVATADWYRLNNENADMRDVTLQQINRYLEGHA